MTTVRTRFAPSPTGYLHVGGARTALYAYLYAKKNKGTFILRIEDTDTERSTPESVQAIVDSLKWLGLDYDEGPFYQTQRFEHYKNISEKLLADKKAYRCYCSKERLDNLRADQLTNKEKPRYDGYCRYNNNDDPHKSYVIRFANPESGEVIFNDAVHGKTVFNNQELDDLIIVRSNGVPTYNFTVVVDDYEMAITHVIRGDDHLNNTPRQINILQALGANIPIYAHIPMILGTDGKRLSKRHGAVSVMHYREDGFLPHALLNYLVRLGWSHGDDEIFSLDQMIDLFDLEHISKSAASFNTSKLIWLNQHYLKTDNIANFREDFEYQLEKLNIVNTMTKNKINPDNIMLIQRERSKTLTEMAEKSRFFYEIIPAPDNLNEKFLTPEFKLILRLLYKALENIPETDFTDDHIQILLHDLSEKAGLKLGDLAQPIRVILSGGTVSPPINSTMRILGKSEVLKRIGLYL